MRRSIRIPLVLTGLVVIGVLAPAAVAARSPDRDIVTFISREELIAAGLISPAADPGVVVQADGQRHVITAEREIVLRCGDASITLTRAGRVIIKGRYILSRSTGYNKIKGAAIDIN